METKAKSVLIVTSPAFKDGELMPKKYSAYGENVNPPLNLEGVPQEAKSLAITVTDLDVPLITMTHWLMWNIPPANSIEENSALGVQGKNSMRRNVYAGPRPPFGKHRYLFKVYALDVMLELDAKAGRKYFEKAIVNHVLAEGELTGIYHR
jgi:Raf kinase inhibitor-like YbhB/YbcL family protein